MLETQHKEEQQEGENSAGKVPLRGHRKLPSCRDSGGCAGREGLGAIPAGVSSSALLEAAPGVPALVPDPLEPLEPVPSLGFPSSPHRWGHPARQEEVPRKSGLETNILI